MTRLLAFCAFIIAAASPAWARLDHYQFDPTHTRILFFVNHLGFSDMVGEFTRYDGSIVFDSKTPTESKLDVTLKPAGIRTSSSLLDNQLQGENFFTSDQFPDIHFVSKAIRITGKKTGDISGDLTMLGVTRPTVLHVKFNKEGYHPITQDFVAGFSADATVKRSEFGMTYLGSMVGDDIRLHIEVEAINQDIKNREKTNRKAGI